MNLICAKSENDWVIARDILLQVIEHLNKNGKKLWSYKQAEIADLKSRYRLEELFFLSSENEVCGMVFIQNIDPIFWSEIEIGESYFLHKLAVLPRFRGLGYGYRILDLAVNLATLNGIKYLRLDCDPRPELISYYENYGFFVVSRVFVGGLPTVKFELLTSRCSITPAALPLPLDSF